jgi:hypothetical protein
MCIIKDKEETIVGNWTQHKEDNSKHTFSVPETTTTLLSAKLNAGCSSSSSSC